MHMMPTRLRRGAAVAFALAALGISGFAERPLAQAPAAPAVPAPAINQSKDPLLCSFRFRSIGPASMGGRIDDIAVSESDPNVIYLGYAAGGVFKSDNNGVSFEPIFETYGSASIGDIAIHPTRSRTSSTSARASRTTARPRRSATASTRPPTAARRSRTSG